MEVFLQTNRFKKDEPQYSRGIGITLDRPTLMAIVEARSDFVAAIDAGRLQVSGDQQCVRALFACLDTFDFNFNIIEP
jgi:alkyl sulfatase BDS1-like metallo-beta-lactamase superfamily hydrolase